jgi:hypothetical protein
MSGAAPAAAQAAGSADAQAAKRVDPKWKAPRTTWGHPDLEGTWTSDDMKGVPMSRAPQYGNRLYLTDQEFAARAKQRKSARDIDDARTGTFRNEEGSREFSYTSMVIDPPDGRVPPTTAAARARPRQGGSFGVGPWEKIQDFSLYDRCITRGAIGSIMPAVYGNGVRIMQSPDAVVITYEMIHDTRVIPLTNKPALGSNIQLFMGDARGHWKATRWSSSRRTTPTGPRSGNRSQHGVAHDGALYANRPADDRLRDHRHRSGDVHEAVDDADDDYAAAGVRDLRVRLSRGEPRHAPCAAG